jgi:hypothetical protein
MLCTQLGDPPVQRSVFQTANGPGDWQCVQKSMSNAKDWQSGLDLPIAASHGLPMEWWGQNLPKQHILSGGGLPWWVSDAALTMTPKSPFWMLVL